jgi:polysaccharide export outer membrane protein
MRALSPFRSVTVLIAFSLLAGSSQSQSVATADANRVYSPNATPREAPSSGSLGSTAETSQFMLGVADIIRVTVWKNADLSQTVTIGPDGFVSLPLLGDVHVAGMTPSQLAKDLSSRLSTYVVNAPVTVSVVDIRSRQVYVTGQVGKPGGYDLVAPITVLQLIAKAGGLNAYANRKKIFILRGSKANLQELKFNYASAIHGDAKQNINLEPGDTVIVP